MIVVSSEQDFALTRMRMRVRVGAASDAGRVRQDNEDAYDVRPDLGLCVVCDGMGGAASGEVASAMAVRTIVEHVAARPEATAACGLGAEQRYLPRTRRLADAVRLANERIYDESQRDARHAGMGTTVVAAWLHEQVASVAHVGDSRAYLWHGGHLDALTRDHSLVEEEVRAGLLDRDASLESAHQNVLLRALGRDPETIVDLTEVPVQAGDRLLLCTDGLTRMVDEDEISRVVAGMREPQQICDRLVAAANRNGGPDNITVIAVAADRGWWRRLWDLRK